MSANTAFPLLALSCSALTYGRPDWFTPLKPAIAPLLGLIMFGMGATLTWRQFSEVARRPRRVGLGLLLQFGVMPLAAWCIGLWLGLSPELLAGLVLVGQAPVAPRPMWSATWRAAMLRYPSHSPRSRPWRPWRRCRS